MEKSETRMILRVVADSPSEEATMEIPRWLYEDMEGAGTWYENEYGKGFSPDYENRVFQEAHKELLEALGKRYNDDPQIAFIQLGSLGHWGEWHVNQHSGIQEFPDSMVTDAYVLDYVNAFPDKNLLMRRPYAITSWEQIGLYNDMFGEPEAQEEWMDWIEDGYVSEQNGEKLPSAPQFWEWGPSGGEIASSRDSSYYFGEGFQDTLRFIKESHTTYLGPNIPLKTELSEEEWKNAQRAQQEMGYCFTIRECTLQQSPRKDKKIQIKWENIGNAPFYEDWDIRIQLENEAGAVLWSKDYKEGLSEWAKTYTMERILPDTANLPKEGISVWAGIVDPMTDMCGVKLAVECPRKRGMYCLGEM